MEKTRGFTSQMHRHDILLLRKEVLDLAESKAYSTCGSELRCSWRDLIALSISRKVSLNCDLDFNIG